MRTFFETWLYGSVTGFIGALVAFVLYYSGNIVFDHAFYIWAGSTAFGCVVGMFGQTPHVQRIKNGIASLFHQPPVVGDDDIAKA